jgi:signal recognition particle subunit SEC65
LESNREIRRIARDIVLLNPQADFLNEALDKAGIERSQVYLTNVVKQLPMGSAGAAGKAAHSQEASLL